MPRIHIEDKHTYNTLPQRALYTEFSRAGSSVDVTPDPVINKLNYPSTGTDESDRIGRKIYTSSVVSEGYIYLDNTLGFQQLLFLLQLVLVESFMELKIILLLLENLVIWVVNILS